LAELEDAIRLFRKSLFHAYYDWTEKNKDAIGEKWYTWFLKNGKKAEGECDTPIKIMGTALWIFNMISGLGVMAGVGPPNSPNPVNIHHIDERLDEKSTKRLLYLISSCLSLQYLPKEIATKPIRIISPKKFSLSLWVEQH